MTTGELARRLRIHPNTIRLWCADYAAYLSDGATGRGHGTARDLGDHDALVLATVAGMRNRGLTHEQITDALKSGQLIDTVPGLPTEAEQEARERVSLVPVSDLHRAIDRIRSLESERDRLVAERDKALIDREKANERIGELQREIGQLQGALSERALTMRVIVLTAFLAVAVIVVIALALRPAG